MTLVAFVIVATGLIATFSARPALGAQSTLTVLGGVVTVRDGEGEFRTATDGELVGPGIAIRTGPASHAVLTYVDGTTVTLEPNSEVVIDRLEFTASGDLIAVVKQAFGKTWHVVQHQVGPGGRYEVRTPAATAAVRGTAFEVGVGPDGEMELITTEGIVAAGNDQGPAVEVGAAQATNVRVDQAPAAPRAAAAPQAVVRIALDPTQNAVAIDNNGRSVGLQNGVPLRYAPGSKVEIVDGRLVLTIPTNDPGRISTIVAAENGSTIDIETEVTSRGAVVSRTNERRTAEDGAAKGGIVVTTAGVIVLPDNEAKRIGAPILGKAPEKPAGADSSRSSRATPVPTPDATPTQRTGSGPSVPFLGAFQAFQSGGGATVVRFTGEPPRELLPPAPPTRDGCAAFERNCNGQVRKEQRGEPPTVTGSLTFVGQTVELPADAPVVFDKGARGCFATIFGATCEAPANSEKKPDPSPSPTNAAAGGGGGQGGSQGGNQGGGRPATPQPPRGFVPPTLAIPTPLGANNNAPKTDKPEAKKPTPSPTRSPVASPKGASGNSPGGGPPPKAPRDEGTKGKKP